VVATANIELPDLRSTGRALEASVPPVAALEVEPPAVVELLLSKTVLANNRSTT
jgi:hypothetical protein